MANNVDVFDNASVEVTFKTTDTAGVHVSHVNVDTIPLASDAATATNQTTIIGHVDGIEALLTTIDADTGAMVTALQLLDNAISGSEMQVDIVSSALPSGAATAALQGALTETAPTTDTASSGLNGRLQRIAQRLTTAMAAETTNTPEQIVVAATTSTVLTTADSGRIRFTIYNPTAAVAYCRKAASAASATAFDFVIPAGESYFSEPFEWAGEIRVYSTPGGTFNFSQSA